MLVTVRGVVVSVKDTGENDRLLGIVTDDMGYMDVFAKGVRRINAKNSASAQMFAYASFCMSSRGGRYYLNSSEPVDIFYGMRTDIERLALASYIAEVLKYAVMSEQPAKEAMRLVLNIFHFLANGGRDPVLLKSIFELRFACCAGFMPRLVGCDICAEFIADRMYFLLDEGILLCTRHFSHDRVKDPADCFVLDRTLLHTVRYICLTDLEKCFSFGLKGKTLGTLSVLSERYLLNCLGHSFPTLDYYRSVKDDQI